MSSVTYVLWLNGTVRRKVSAMVPLDGVMTSSYKLSTVTYVAISSGLAAIFNAKFLPTSIIDVSRITVS